MMRPMGHRVDTDLELVSELIKPETHQWNEQLVCSVFFVPDADHIMKIPLRLSGGKY